MRVEAAHEPQVQPVTENVAVFVAAISTPAHSRAANEAMTLFMNNLRISSPKGTPWTTQETLRQERRCRSQTTERSSGAYGPRDERKRTRAYRPRPRAGHTSGRTHRREEARRPPRGTAGTVRP